MLCSCNDSVTLQIKNLIKRKEFASKHRLQQRIQVSRQGCNQITTIFLNVFRMHVNSFVEKRCYCCKRFACTEQSNYSEEHLCHFYISRHYFVQKRLKCTKARVYACTHLQKYGKKKRMQKASCAQVILKVHSF